MSAVSAAEAKRQLDEHYIRLQYRLYRLRDALVGENFSLGWGPGEVNLLSDFGVVGLKRSCGHVGLELLTVYRDCRKMGHGSAMLEALLQGCRETGIPVVLYPKVPPAMARDRVPKLTTRQLRSWYKRHGFTDLKEWPGMLIYNPPEVKIEES